MKRTTTRLILAATLGVAAIAIAQAPAVLAVTHGEGVAQSANNRRAEFNFEVVKRATTNTAEPAVRGRFRLDTVSPNPAERIRVITERVNLFDVANNVGEFSGPGMVVRNTPNGPQRVEGKVMVRVVDNWNPTPGTTPQPGGDRPRDTIQVRVVRPNPTAGGNPVVLFEFQGQVMRGNLVVRVPQAPNP